MREHYEKIIKDTEKRVRRFLKNQVMEKDSPHYGGLIEGDSYVDPAKASIFYLSDLGELYLNPQSRFYNDPQTLERVRIALDYELRMQRPDGTFDYYDCNFYSAPDTAFYINRLISFYYVVKKYNHAPENAWLEEKLYQLIEKAGHGMAKGGFHTPNHRWAIAAALSSCYNITKITAFKERAADYLLEGQDCNADGEYAERSAGNYNTVNNEQMIILAQETKDERYLGNVRRNLEMSLHYIDPDGSVFTNNSTRQDYGTKRYPEYYYSQYLFMAWKLNNPVFAAAAAQIMEDITERGDLAPDCLDWYMLYPELIAFPLPTPGIPVDYQKFYPDSGIVRARRGDYSYSLILGNTRFLYFQVGALCMYMKIGVSYFDQREFKAQSLEKDQDGYKLGYLAHGWYYLPFNEKPETSDWWKMDHSKREKLSGPDLKFVVSVKEIEDGIAVNVATQGCDRVPIKIEMAFTPESEVRADGFNCEATPGNAVTVKNGQVEVTRGLDTMVVGPAFATHNFVGGKFGSEARSNHHFTVYFADFTNFSHTINIRKK